MKTNNTELTNAINFLLFSYFGITFSDKKESIIYATARRAYNDATMRSALVFKKNKDEFNNNEKAEEYNKLYQKFDNERETIRYIVKEKTIEIVVSKFKNLGDNTNFNIWHKELCKKLVDTVDKKYDELLKENCKKLHDLEKVHQQYFTYGNAQKFVNMFIKNLYILTTISQLYEEDEKAKNWYDNYSWIINNSAKFHIPIDSYVLEYTKIKTEHPWSKINEYTEEYEKIHKEIKKNNIDFSNENECWIWQAKLEGLKDKKAKLIKYNKKVRDNFFVPAIKSLETEIEDYKNNNKVE